MFGMTPWKVSGPDGFPAGFYQKSWSVMGRSACEYVKGLWENPSRIVDINNTNIFLIPKIIQPEFVSQFRTIYLCNVNY